MTGGRGRKHKQLLDDLKKRGNLKEEVILRPLWRTGIGRVRRKTENT